MSRKKLRLEYRDYLMIPSVNAKDRFDLYKKGIFGKGIFGTGKHVGEASETVIGYGFRFLNALHMIAALELAKKSDITSINKYIKEYKLMMEKIEKDVSL